MKDQRVWIGGTSFKDQETANIVAGYMFGIPAIFFGFLSLFISILTGVILILVGIFLCVIGHIAKYQRKNAKRKNTRS